MNHDWNQQSVPNLADLEMEDWWVFLKLTSWALGFDHEPSYLQKTWENTVSRLRFPQQSSDNLICKKSLCTRKSIWFWSKRYHRNAWNAWNLTVTRGNVQWVVMAVPRSCTSAKIPHFLHGTRSWGNKQAKVGISISHSYIYVLIHVFYMGIRWFLVCDS